MKRAQPGYYPGFRTLDQKNSGMRRRGRLSSTVLKMCLRFASSRTEEQALMEAVCRHILPQDDRDEAHTFRLSPRSTSGSSMTRMTAIGLKTCRPIGKPIGLGCRRSKRFHGIFTGPDLPSSVIGHEKNFCNPCMMAIRPPRTKSGSECR